MGLGKDQYVELNGNGSEVGAYMVPALYSGRWVAVLMAVLMAHGMYFHDFHQCCR